MSRAIRDAGRRGRRELARLTETEYRDGQEIARALIGAFDEIAREFNVPANRVTLSANLYPRLHRYLFSQVGSPVEEHRGRVLTFQGVEISESDFLPAGAYRVWGPGCSRSGAIDRFLGERRVGPLPEEDHLTDALLSGMSRVQQAERNEWRNVWGTMNFRTQEDEVTTVVSPGQQTWTARLQSLYGQIDERIAASTPPPEDVHRRMYEALRQQHNEPATRPERGRNMRDMVHLKKRDGWSQTKPADRGVCYVSQLVVSEANPPVVGASTPDQAEFRRVNYHLVRAVKTTDYRTNRTKVDYFYEEE